MIRASGLYGRQVIDLDTAERVGDIDEIIVDPYGPCIAGYVVAGNRPMLGSKRRIIVPTDAVHAIGPDAVTMRSVGATEYHTAHLDALPRLSELTGRRMVSFGGRYLGSVEDALVSERDGRIIGYPLDRSGPGTWLDTAFGLGWRTERPDYVRADAALRIGAHLIVVPDDAIAAGADLEDAEIEDAARPEGTAFSTAAAEPDVRDPLPTVSDDAIRESQARTAPFTMDDLQVTDEGLGLEPSAERDRDTDDADRPAVDPEQDTVLLASSSTGRNRSRRRPQAEKIR